MKLRVRPAMTVRIKTAMMKRIEVAMKSKSKPPLVITHLMSNLKRRVVMRLRVRPAMTVSVMPAMTGRIKTAMMKRSEVAMKSKSKTPLVITHLMRNLKIGDSNEIAGQARNDV